MKVFYETLAKGGVGLIIIESTGVDYPVSNAHLLVQTRLDEDKYVPGYSELAEVIHKHGCKTFLNLFHAGACHPSHLSGVPKVSSSSEPPNPGYGEPIELTITGIREIVDQFADAAERAHKAGFDGVEINASSTHLINSFLSRVWNKRNDAYGCQDLASRARFLVEIIQEIKKRAGQDFAVCVLITGAEFGIDKGTTPEEARGFAKLLQDAGADALQVRGFGYEGSSHMHPAPEQMLYPEPTGPLPRELDWSRKGAGAFVPLAAAVKQVVSIPVIVVGRLDPILGEEVLQQGKADFIAFNRRLMADPEFPNKVAEGRLEDIAPCNACLYCWHIRQQGLHVKCRVNAALGIEREYAIKAAEQKKRVLVAGSGPAGMEAARVAALRGHEVILYEKEHELGGLLPVAALVKGMDIEDVPALVRYLKTQITKLGVKIIPGKEVNPTVIDELKPEVVILATGGTPTIADIPGIDSHNVVKSSDIYRRINFFLRFFKPKVLRWLTRFWIPIGKNVVIIGGAIQGCELAEFLIKRGRRVTIVDTAEELGDNVIPELTRTLLFNWLAKKDVSMLSGVKYEEITDRGLTVITREGVQQTITADTIVPALPLTSNVELLKTIEGKVPEIYTIGDCKEPRLMVDAIADGSRIGRAI
jgi:2,4-dienoyl-CoA reductase (NADPH2)